MKKLDFTRSCSTLKDSRVKIGLRGAWLQKLESQWVFLFVLFSASCGTSAPFSKTSFSNNTGHGFGHPYGHILTSWKEQCTYYMSILDELN